MSLLDFLSGKTECPNCGTKGAKKSGDQIRCPNPHCSNFDPELEGQGTVRRVAATPQGSFAPARPITVRYLNYQRQDKTFTADADSAVRKGNHVSMCVTPSGIRIALSRDRIQNLREVEEACPERVAPGQEGPSRRERQVLSYHKNRGTTSPLYEKIRAKYPQW